MRGIDKAFPGVQALEGVDFAVADGEIHALVGENGAGKSTLIKILTGVERPDGGTIRFAGQDVVVRSPQHAQSLGISTVYQEINLCPNLSVAENIFIGREPRQPGPTRLAVDEPPGGRAAPEPRHRGGRHAAAGLVLGGHPADDGHRAGARDRVGAGPDPGRADLQPRRARDAPAVRGHAQAAGERHLGRLHHPLPRPGLRSRRPHHGPAQRPARRHVRDGRACRGSSSSRRCSGAS